MKIKGYFIYCALFPSVLAVLSLSALANTVYLVRHAEKQDNGTDPALSVCGQARADALSAYFADVNLQAIYSTPYQRTLQTVAVIASNKDLTVINYNPSETEQFVQQLMTHTEPVLVVGHSNTVPQLVTLLTGIKVAPLTEQDYEMLYHVELGKKVTLSQQVYRCIKKEKPEL